MRVVPVAKDPRVRSYLELRSAVGWIALGLPLTLVCWSLLAASRLVPGSSALPTSISGYYYTPMRNLLVGCLCAIGFFNLCARGYEWRDELAGIVSAVCAVSLAFCPTAPPGGGSPLDQRLSSVHNTLGEVFFITLGIMCLALFRTTARNRSMTRAKLRRNRVFTVCGVVMAVCGAVDFVCHRMRPIPMWGPLGSIFCCELVALEAFGIAWLVKGKTLLTSGRHTRRNPRQMAGA
jgi:hypothetical protein